jgi:hypothetical protein
LFCGSRIMSAVRAASWEWCIHRAVHYFSCDYLSLLQNTDRGFS